MCQLILKGPLPYVSTALRELDSQQVRLPANVSQWPTAVLQQKNPLWLKKFFPLGAPL